MLLKEIIPLYNTLVSIKDKEMPIRISYKFSKLLIAVETEYNYYMESFRKIAFKYGQRDENGDLIFDDNGNIKIKLESIDNANKELKELDEVEIQELPKITFTLEELENLSFKPTDVQTMIPFIQED